MINLVNTSAIILTPKKKFFDWLCTKEISKYLPEEKKQLLENLNYSVLQKNGTVIAIPKFKNNFFDKAESYILENASDILLAELHRWGLNGKFEISKPHVELILTWFEISNHTQLFADLSTYTK